MNKDILLKILVEITESFSKDKKEEEVNGTSITLTTNGMLVSGKIVTKEQFMKSNPTTSTMWSILEEENKKNESEEIPQTKDFEYIHLSDVSFSTPGNLPVAGMDSPIYWRGRLSEISGFCFGEIRKIES